MPALCVELGVSRHTVYYHLHQHPEYDRLMAKRVEQGHADHRSHATWGARRRSRAKRGSGRTSVQIEGAA
jgi:hypothetical protein